jgi:hypothetical protein
MAAVYRKPPEAPKRPPAPPVLAYRPEKLIRTPAGHAGFLSVLVGLWSAMGLAAAGLADLALPGGAVVCIATYVLRKREDARPLAHLRVEGARLRVALGDGSVLCDVALDELIDVALDTKAVEHIIENPGLNPVLLVDAKVAAPVHVARIELVTTSGAVRFADTYFSHSDALEWKGKIRQFLRKHGWEPSTEREGAAGAQPAERARARAVVPLEPAPTPFTKTAIGGWLWLWPVALVAFPLVTLRMAHAALHSFDPSPSGSAWWVAQHLAPELATRTAVAAGLGIVRFALWLIVCEATLRRLATTSRLVFALAALTLVEGLALALLPAPSSLEPRLLAPYFAWAVPAIAYFAWAKRPASTFVEAGRPRLWVQAGGVAAMLGGSFVFRASSAPGPVVDTSPIEQVGWRILADDRFGSFHREESARLRAAGEKEDLIQDRVADALADATARGTTHLPEADLAQYFAIRHAMLDRVPRDVCADVWRGGPKSARVVPEGIRQEDVAPWVALRMKALELGRLHPAEREPMDDEVARALILASIAEADRKRLHEAWTPDRELDDAEACWAQRKVVEGASKVAASRRLDALRWLASFEL